MPSKPRHLCLDCTKAYARTWRKSNWQAVKLRDTWRGMIDRCHNPVRMRRWANACKFAVYRDYGAEGVKVCRRWRGENGLALFSSDMGPPPTKEHTLDRIRPSRGLYSPGNCRWATPAEQAANRKNTYWLTAKDPVSGESATLSLSEWARRTGKCRTTIKKWIDKGIDPSTAVAQAMGKVDGVPF
jgi:hypothetical protein